MIILSTGSAWWCMLCVYLCYSLLPIRLHEAIAAGTLLAVAHLGCAVSISTQTSTSSSAHAGPTSESSVDMSTPTQLLIDHEGTIADSDPHWVHKVNTTKPFHFFYKF